MPRGTSRLDEARLQGRLWTPAVLAPSLWLRADDPLNYALSSTGRSNPWGPLDNAADAGRLLYEPTGWQSRQPAFIPEDSLRAISGASAVSTAELYIAVVHQETFRTTSNGVAFVGGSATIRCHFPFSDATYYWDVGPGRVSVTANAVGTHNQVGLQTSATRNLQAIYLDGTTGGTGAAPATQTAPTFELGRDHIGRFAEIVVIQTAVSDAMRQRIEGYLGHKWNIAERLPASHPFRNNPPLIGG